MNTDAPTSLEDTVVAPAEPAAAAPRLDALDIGDELNGWRILERIGIGGMGEVYRARSRDGEVRALKVIRADLAADRDMRRRFLREARAAARFEHPNIVRVLDYDDTGPRAYIAMELVDGGTLDDWRARPAPGWLVKSAFLEILLALGFAHARGVVHRDLKPENILLARNADGSTTVRVLDFGVAHFREDRAADADLDAGLVGTPAYMSPEQAIRADEVGPATDLYAVGVMLFETITGRLPFVGKGAVGTLMAHLKDELPPIVPRDGYTIDTRTEALIRRLLARDPAKRFLFAADARRELEQCTIDGHGGDPAAAPPEDPPDVETAPGPVGASSPPDARLPPGDPAGPRQRDGLGLFSLREPPFRGRRDELAELHELAHEVLTTRRSCVALVSGAMGLGKSRLLAVLREELESAGLMQAWVGGYDDIEQSGDAAIRQALRRGLGINSTRPLDIRQHASKFLKRHENSLGVDLDSLLELLTATTRDERPAILADEDARLEMAIRTIHIASGDRPVLLVVDDAHLSDGAPFRLAERLLAESRDVPCLLVIAWRPEQCPADSPQGAAIARLRATATPERLIDLVLRPLGMPDILGVIRGCIHLGNDEVRQLAVRAEGRPLYAVELLRHAVQSGLVRRNGTDLTQEQILLELPQELGSIIEKRLVETARAAGDPALVEVWMQLAILGPQFRTDVARQIWQRHDDEEGLQRLDRALDVGVIGALMAEVDGPAALRFDTRPVRETLVDMARAAGLAPGMEHAAAQARLRACDGRPGEESAEIARHLERAGRVDEAFDMLRIAADWARGVNRFREALDAWETAQRIASTPERLAEAHLAYAATAIDLGLLDDAARSIDAVRRPLQTDGRPTPPEASRLLAELMRRKGDFERAGAQFRIALAAFERVGDPRGVALTRFGLGELELAQGRPHEAEPTLRAAREIFEKLGNLRMEAAAYRALGDAALHARLLDEAAGFFRKARYRASELLNDRLGTALADLGLAEVAVARGQLDEAHRLFEAATLVLEALGDLRGAGIGRLGLGRVAALGGFDTTARDAFRRALRSFQQRGEGPLEAMTRLHLARIDTETGQWDDAATGIERALELDAPGRRIDDPRFAELLIDLSRSLLFAGQAALARRLLQVASLKLERVARGSSLEDRVEEVEYLLSELQDDDAQGDSTVDLESDDPPDTTGADSTGR